MKLPAGWLALALLAASAELAAGEPPHWGLGKGFYVAPLYSYGAVDFTRHTGDGEGRTLAAGYRWEFASLELRHASFELPRSDGAGNAEMTDTVIGFQVAPLQDLRIVSNVYGALGVGRTQRVNHPGFARDGDGDVFQAGLGVLVPFEPFGFGLAARLEASYRLETPDPPRAAGEPSKFEDTVFHFGLQARLAGRRPAPRLPAVPDAPAMPPALLDGDDDGVIDELDRCPGTVPGSLVDRTGCVPEPPDRPVS